MKSFVLVVALIGSLNAQTLADKLLGDQKERMIDYVEKDGKAFKGVVIRYDKHNHIEMVFIQPVSREIYTADNTGQVISYMPVFDNCDPNYNVIRYSLKNSVAGMKDQRGIESWKCSVRLNVVTKFIGTGSVQGRKIQEQFNALVQKYTLSAAPKAVAGPRPASGKKSQSPWQWPFTITNAGILVMAVIAFCAARANVRPQLASMLSLGGLLCGIIMGFVTLAQAHLVRTPNPFSAWDIVTFRSLSYHDEWVVVGYSIVSVCIGMVPLMGMAAGVWLNKRRRTEL